MNVRKLPMWTRFQTVGPHVYMRTWPRSIGSTATSSRLIVSCSCSVTAVSSSTVAEAAIPSLRPEKPMPSVVVAPTAIVPGSRPSASDIASDIAPEMCGEPRFLGDRDDVGAGDHPALLTELLGDDRSGTRSPRCPSTAGRRDGKVPAHVAEPRRAEDGVDERVHHRVAVGVAQQAAA